MIFSTQEDKKESEAFECESKERLQTIIRNYMTSKKYEDITFLRDNFRSTEDLIFCIRSSQINGLTSQNVENNRMYYGQNVKKVPDSFPQLKECIFSHIKQISVILYLVVICSTLVYSIVCKNSMIFDSSLKGILVFLVALLIQIGVKFYWSCKLQSEFLRTVKKDFYQVIRNGCYIQVQESQLVVGDIVELGFNQKVPATGLIISNKQIFLTENNKIKPKLSFEECLKKIQKMSLLQLKLQEQNNNMISPVVLRGSQLLQGSVFSMILISVNEEQLIKSHGFYSQDQFTWPMYEKTIMGMEKRWRNWSLFVGIGTAKIMLLNILTQIYLSSMQQKVVLQKVFLFFLQITAILLCLSSLPLRNFLQTILLKFLSRVSRKSEFKKLFNLKTLICDQVKIFEENETKVFQVVLPGRHDIISSLEFPDIHPSNFQIMNELQHLFQLKFDMGNFSFQQQRVKYKKIVYLHKQFHRIISVYCEPSQSKKQAFNIKIPLIEQIRKAERSQTFNSRKQNQEVNGQKKQKQPSETGRFLKIPNVSNSHFNQNQNIKDVIQYKCKIKSRSVLGTFVGLAENGLRTYYFEPYNEDMISQVQFLNCNGNNIGATYQAKQKLIQLSRQLNILYQLKPIMISFSEGSYNPAQSRCLVCILGIRTKVNQEVIQKVKSLSKFGINPIFTIGKVPQTYKNDICEEDIVSELKSRGLIEGLNDQIIDGDRIRKMLGRLICPFCFLSKCECKQKNKIFTNIQSFIQNWSTLRIIYNVDSYNFEDIKKILQQISPTVFTIRGQNTSLTNEINSVFAFMQFIGTLQSSTILFYIVSITYFTLLVTSWFFSKLLDPLQIIICYFLFIIFLSFSIFIDNKNYEREGDEIQEVKIISKDQTIIKYTICFFILLGAQLFQIFHQLIPEYADDYDLFISQQSFSSQICKYGPHHSVTKNFSSLLCSTQSYLQFSRLSTLVLVYVFSSLWILSVGSLKNFTSKISIFLYPSFMLILVLIVQKWPNLIHAYSNGLTWQQYLIVSLGSIIMIMLGYLIGKVILKIRLVKEVQQELQVKIEWERRLVGEQSTKLKQYCRKKKLKKQQSLSILQKFLSNF